MTRMRLRHSLSAYAANFRLGAAICWGDLADLCSTVFIYVILLLIFAGIYKVLPVAELDRSGLTRGHLLWYFALTEIVIMSSQGNEREFGRLIGAGQLTTLMQRPGSMLGLLLARVAGSACSQAAVLIPVAYVALSLFTDTALPVEWVLVPALLGSLGLGIVIFLLLGYAIGALEVLGPYSRPTSWIVNKLVFTFGGLFFPVLFFPPVLQHIVAFTPFPSIIGAPANFALLQDKAALLHGVGLQLVWLLVALGCALYAERRAVRFVLTKGD